MATIQAKQTIGSIWAVNLSGDPSLAGGTVAPIGTFGGTTDGTGLWSKTGAGDTAWNKAILNNIGIAGGTTLTGGTEVTDAMIYKGTSANATSTLVAHTFVGGNNGATTIASLYNDGQFLIGTTTRNPVALGILRIAQGTSTVDIGDIGSASSAIWLGQIASYTPSVSNFTIKALTTITTINAAGTTGDINLSFNNTTRYNFGAREIVFTPNVRTGGTSNVFTFTSPASTGLTASTEVNGVVYSLTTNRQWSTGALAMQREILWNQVTYRAVGASAFTDIVNVAYGGAPIASTNITATNSHNVLIQAGSALTNTTNGYGLTCNAPTGATNNFAAQFLGGGVILSGAALATNATTGFTYLPSCAGTPTGVPTAVTGTIPCVVDSTNNKMYIYSGGAWVALN